MEFNEAKDVLEELYVVYPRFNRNDIENFDRIWIKRLMEGDYNKTLRKARLYMESNPFPPSLADVLVKEPRVVPPGESELAKARAAVEAELADPVKAKEREEALERARRKFEELKKNGR